jgi:crossover junction endodeoxyribonuclease RusA
MILNLPYPPTINHYWRHVGRKVLISAGGRAFRQNVLAEVVHSHGNARFAAADRLAVAITVAPPDRRKRDLDNLLKPLLDALEKAGIYANDAQIDDLFISRLPVDPAGVGKIQVTITKKKDKK